MSWKVEYALLIMFSTLVDYFSGIQIEKSATKYRKIIFLYFSIITNMGMLIFFKYFNFFSETARQIISQFSLSFDPVTLNVILPIGISFYTFQALTYTIDIYRKGTKAERHLGIFATYIIYFPQLVAGPIERAKNLLPQFYEKHYFEYKRVTDGLKLMLWGFFKKVVIADRLAIVVDQVYNNAGNYTGIPLILATVFFALQIYCDFSGYSDIAIGSAQIMGIRLMDNFKRPYFSKSINEFWRRWHISLSSWFRDYLYIPLGGSRVSVPRWYLNLFIVFLVVGIWHGANWTFIIWGVIHGFYLVFSAITKNIRGYITSKIGLYNYPRMYMLLQVTITFTLVNIGWVFFRANTISDAFYILTHMFSNWGSKIRLGGVIGYEGIIIAFASILFMEFIHLLQEHIKMRQFLSDKPILARWSIYLIIIFGILLFGIFESRQFIYFQF